MRSGPQPYAVLDLGTSKICCLIAMPDAEGRPMSIGIGYQRSQGVKSGQICDPAAAESAVRAAISQAERMAGVSLDGISVGISCGRLSSASFTAKASVAGDTVAQSDMVRVISGGEAYVERSGRGIVQLARSDWRIDGTAGIRDPRGLAGRELSVELTAVTADEPPVRNFLSVVERCHLAVESVAATPHASAMAVTHQEERVDGVLTVDIGAGVTSIAAFAGGRLLLAQAIPVGGNHITYDIARSFGTSVAEAERIKTLYGTLVKASSDETELIHFPVQNGDEIAYEQTTMAHLGRVIEPRISSLLGLIEERLRAAGLAELLSRRVVLTGGASQLQGLDLTWASRFQAMVRVGRPRPIGRMPANMCGPAYAAVLGLAWGARAAVEAAAGSATGRFAAGGYIGRVRHWIGSSF